jgi:hypothetical protein
MLIGRLSQDGRVNARVKCDLTENLALKINAQVMCFFVTSQVDGLTRLALLNFLNSLILLILCLQMTSEPGYSHGMFSFDYKVDLSPLFVHLFSRAILATLHCFFFVRFNE